MLKPEQCEIHNRPCEFICINCKVRICSNCGLFGDHKNHDIRNESDVVNEITIRTDLLIEMF